MLAENIEKEWKQKAVSEWQVRLERPVGEAGLEFVLQFDDARPIIRDFSETSIDVASPRLVRNSMINQRVQVEQALGPHTILSFCKKCGQLRKVKMDVRGAGTGN